MEIEEVNKPTLKKVKDVKAGHVFRRVTVGDWLLRSSHIGLDGDKVVYYCINLNTGELERIYELVSVQVPHSAKVIIDWNV